MRKVIVGCCALMSALNICSTSAENALRINDNGFYVVEDSSQDNKQDNKIKNNGFYVACGLLGSKTKGKVSYLGDTVPTAVMLLYTPATPVPIGKLDPVNKGSWSFGGSAAFGFGSTVCGTYVGGEFLADVSPSNALKDKYELYGDEHDNRLKTNALIPSFMLRLGGYVDRFGALFLVRVGVAKVSFEYVDTTPRDIHNLVVNSFKSNKLTTVLGVSIEKMFGKFGVRCDYDYRFKAVKRGSLYDVGGYNYYIRASLSSHVVRVMAIFSF